jgi:hypothetical protein
VAALPRRNYAAGLTQQIMDREEEQVVSLHIGNDRVSNCGTAVLHFAVAIKVEDSDESEMKYY